MKNKIFNLIRSISYFFPNILFTASPFKIIEFLELKKNVKFQKLDVILDIGCGDGLETLLLGRKCKKIYGIDISSERILFAKNRAQFKKNKNNFEFRNVKLEEAKFNQNFFDKVFSICVLEHIENYEAILKEVYSILKKDGQLIFSVDSLENIRDKNLILSHKKEFFVQHYFNRIELKTLLSKIGYKNIIIYPILKSEYAKRIFREFMINRFKINLITFIPRYLLLRINELRYRNELKGLFLIAKCFK